MASNISQNTIPYVWSSANDDVIFTFNFQTLSIASINNYMIGSFPTGKITVTLDGLTPFLINPTIGDKIYLQTPLYTGVYVISDVISSTVFRIITPYLGGVTASYYSCYHLRIPTFTLHKGFLVGEFSAEAPINNPYTKVVDIKPTLLYAGSNIPYLSINVKGAVKYIFNIKDFSVANEVDYSLFNAIRFTWDDKTTIRDANYNYVFVLNSAISNDELVKNYISEGIYLTPLDKPFINSQGVTLLNKFDHFTMVPILHVYINGVKI